MEKKNGVYTDESVEDVKKRLYERGAPLEKIVKHELSDTKIDVSRNWGIKLKTQPNTSDLRSSMETQATPNTTVVDAEPKLEKPPKKKHRYRSFVLIGSLVIFMFMVVASTLFLYFGGNQISSNNIQVAVVGPGSIGGGQVLPLTVTVANQNSVPIQSALLVLRYPEGTQSVDDVPRTLYEERIPVGSIDARASKEIPVSISVFGEAGDNREIVASLEYRIEGSSGTFVKEAEGYGFQITSSPLVLKVESVEKVASGQRVEVEVSVVSNAATPIRDILLSASYPTAFAFDVSQPKPISGQNVWHIDEILPESKATIVLEGVVQGYMDESFRLNLSAGKASPENPYEIGAVLAEASFDYVIERPFIDINIAVNDKKGSQIILSKFEESNVLVAVKNTLDETVYDMAVELEFEGNAIEGGEIQTLNSLYDSRTQSIRWDVAEDESLERVLPGDQRQFKTAVLPGPARAGAFYKVTVNVFARRVSEPNAQELLIGSSQFTVRFSSSPTISSQNGRNTRGYDDRGPVPPKVGEITSYTPTIVAEVDTNDLTEAVVQFKLPIYVTWLGRFQPSDAKIIYNPISRVVEWELGDLSAGQRRELVVQLDVEPRYSQLESSPIIIDTQYLMAKDNFSDGRLQVTASPVTTELSTEMGYREGSGLVVE